MKRSELIEIIRKSEKLTSVQAENVLDLCEQHGMTPPEYYDRSDESYAYDWEIEYEEE